MKTKFAKEKSRYAHLLVELMGRTTPEESQLIKSQLKILEDYIELEDDNIIFIVTTEKTNPMPELTAPPMSKEDIIN